MSPFAFLASCAAGILVADLACAQPAPPALPGTYETMIRRGPRGAPGSRVLVTGTVVLMDARNISGDLPRMPAASLAARSAALLHALRWDGQLDSIRSFFPQDGDWTYVHTAHPRDGDRRAVWRFPGGETRRAIDHAGPIPHVFSINYHGQPIGLLVHQVMLRGVEWRRVAGNRYVPPGASSRSPTFIEWRREGVSWVVSAIGDESFPSGDLPSWCC